MILKYFFYHNFLFALFSLCYKTCYIARHDREVFACLPMHARA